MKNSKLLLFLFAMLSITIYNSCKKDPTSDPKPIIPTVVPDNTVCDGNLKNTFCPLDTSTAWVYSYKRRDTLQTVTPIIRVMDSTTYGSYKYARLHDYSGLLDTLDTYLREDTASHDIYNYNVGASAEYLEVPNAPTIGQTWAIPGSLNKKVTNLGADIHTVNCWYTHLLEISVFRGNTIIFKYYYKRGFGLIDRIDPINNTEFAIASVHFR